MKLTLVVLTPGKMEGKSIPIALSQFLIGRDPQCHLRPASALISKRHCAVLIRNNKAFVRDFDSTNGTFLNDQPIKGEHEVKNGDQLKVGPLHFRVVLDVTAPAPAPAPAPVAANAAMPAAAAPLPASDDEAAAAMLLSGLDVGLPVGGPVDRDGVPTGSTVMEIIRPPSDDTPPEGPKPEESSASKRETAAKAAQGNTSSAAAAILQKYMRRPRT